MSQRRAAFTAMREVLSASEDISGERANRLKRVAELFGLDGEGESTSNVAPFDPRVDPKIDPAARAS